jgi:hypothetical protein
VNTPVMFQLACAQGGGIFADIVRSDYGPMLVFHTARASQGAFLAQDGKILGRWALGEKHQLGRLGEARWQRKIVLRERWYQAGERADPVDYRWWGAVRAWCDGRRHYHEVELAALIAEVHRGRSDVLVVGETVGYIPPN